MKTVLGLDISTATIGWSILEYDDHHIGVLSFGYIKPKGNEFIDKADFAYDSVQDLLDEYKPDFVAIEDFAKRFSKGRSNIGTILKLAAFNRICELAVLRGTGQRISKYAVVSIRASLRRFFNTKAISKDNVEATIILFCAAKNVLITEINRSKNIRKEVGDITDAIAVALKHVIEDRKDG